MLCGNHLLGTSENSLLPEEMQEFSRSPVVCPVYLHWKPVLLRVARTFPASKFPDASLGPTLKRSLLRLAVSTSVLTFLHSHCHMKGICPHRSFLVSTSVSLLFNLSLSLSLVAHLFILFLFKILIYLKGRDRAHPSIITLPRCLPQLGLGQAEARKSVYLMRW